MIIIQQLLAQGVRHFFLAPGSRSTPLVIALSRHPEAILHRHFDERGLGFYATGFGLGREAPGVVIVTSGTAAGNLTPAIMEAHHASIPLIILTADRPHELRDISANQTTDQCKMFENFIRWQCEITAQMPPAAVRSKIAQGVFRAQHPHPGPVHINCPFQEPLYDEMFVPTQLPSPIQLETPPYAPCAPRELPARGICLVGRLPKRSDVEACLALAKKLQWPLFGDLLSNARLYASDELIPYFDWGFWTSPPTPDCILHLGERLTSKRLMEWLASHPPKQYIHVSPQGHWVDPSSLLTERILTDIASATANLTNTPDTEWLRRWKQISLPPIEPIFTETSAMRTLSTLSLDQWAIFLANSMPIREADWFLFPQACIGFFANRGLSGIDGNIATVAGLACGLNAPVVAILGDTTTLHDLNSLALLQKSPHPIILLISNNNGCGIFSHLSVAPDPHFETLFGFPHTLNFAHAAHMFQLPYAFVETDEALENAMNLALASGQSRIIEMKTCRTQNYKHHQKMKQCLR